MRYTISLCGHLRNLRLELFVSGLETSHLSRDTKEQGIKLLATDEHGFRFAIIRVNQWFPWLGIELG